VVVILKAKEPMSRCKKDELDGRMEAYRKNLDIINELDEDIKNRELSGPAKACRGFIDPESS
jgi:hypothetical protein